MPDAVFFADAAAWRAWLVKHHATETELLVGFVKVTTGEATMTWSQSVDEALCFGWIDGVRHGIDDRTYSIRFTPRKPTSIWSAVNVKKVAALRDSGLMTEAGEAAYAARKDAKTGIYSFETPPAEFSAGEQKRFEKHKQAWAFWQKQAPSYRRAATHWVVSPKREETRVRRFNQLLEDCAAGRRLRHLSY